MTGFAPLRHYLGGVAVALLPAPHPGRGVTWYHRGRIDAAVGSFERALSGPGTGDGARRAGADAARCFADRRRRGPPVTGVAPDRG